MKKPLGCLSTSGIITAVIILVAITGLMWIGGGSIFNPGPLNAQTGATSLGGATSHADLLRQCGACHPSPWGSDTMDNRCLDCHTGVAAELSTAAGLHGAMAAHNDGVRCVDCHTEHQGSAAALTIADARQFPHTEATGFSLQAHQTVSSGAPFACTDCHPDTLTRFDLLTCDICHRQIDTIFVSDHVTTFGVQCLACHDGVDSYGAAFDHNQTAFSLEGRHTEAQCEACHRGQSSLATLQATDQTCFGCHQQDDAHQGRLGQDCKACHTPDSWENATFDHNLTTFPLTGAHVPLECEACHLNNVYEGTPTDCFGCHQQDDAHQGQFGQVCEVCHTPDSWENATFDHNLTTFPLTGAHVPLECEACHLNNVYEGTPTDCFGCHQQDDAHQGQYGTVCIECHTTTAWTPAQYTGPHPFPMDHGESGVSPCATCHPDSLQTYTCYGCHEHTPANIEAEHREEGIFDFQDCVRCHPTGREEEGEGGHGDDD